MEIIVINVALFPGPADYNSWPAGRGPGNEAMGGGQDHQLRAIELETC